MLDPSFRKIFNDVYSQFPEEYSKVFSVKTSDRAYEKISSASGFGIAKDVKEAEEIPAEDAVQGFDETFTHKKVGNAFFVSKELLEDDQFNVIAGKPRQLADSISRKVETDCAQVFDYAGVTTYNSGPDGAALASTAHLREDGKNLPSIKLLNLVELLVRGQYQARKYIGYNDYGI